MEFSKRSISRMAGVHPELVLIFNEAIAISPIDFGIPADGGVRTAERQNEIFKTGKGTKVDGYKKLSRHQIKPGEEYGRALDVYAYVGGKASWEKHHLAMVAGAILGTANRLRAEGRIKGYVRWGGTFGSDTLDGWDLPHYEIYFTG